MMHLKIAKKNVITYSIIFLFLILLTVIYNFAKVNDNKTSYKNTNENVKTNKKESSGFRIIINSKLKLCNNKLDVMVNNVNTNKYGIKFKIVLDGEKNMLYESQTLWPGEILDYITIEEDLPENFYNGKVYVSGINKENNKTIITIAKNITIKKVKNS